MRRLLLFAVALGLALPSAGCLERYTPLHGGMGSAAWPLELTQVMELQDSGRTGAGIKVAVVDTGIDASHPEFAGVNVEWADLVNDRSEPYDDNGHGTHVAGVIAARGSFKTVLSGFYLHGVAPQASLIVIKAIRSDGIGDESTVARAVQLAVANDADIIVLSLGGGSTPILGTDTEAAVRDAVASGVYVVAAAGNKKDGETSCAVSSPASVANVIAVGAVDADEKLADFSCRGTGSSSPGPLPGLGVGGESDPDRKPEILAPGVSILGPCLTTGPCMEGPDVASYVEASGTSQAAPFVGGILALILEGHPELRQKGATQVEKVKTTMMVTAKKIGPLSGKGRTAHDEGYGYGLIQAKALDESL